MTERDAIYLQILRHGLLRIRDSAALGHLEYCAVESEHLHNIPSPIGRPTSTGTFTTSLRSALNTSYTLIARFPAWTSLYADTKSFGFVLANSTNPTSPPQKLGF
jgi:hypothetical protein